MVKYIFFHKKGKISKYGILEFSGVFLGTPLSLREICWRSGVPIEGEPEGEDQPLVFPQPPTSQPRPAEG